MDSILGDQHDIDRAKHGGVDAMSSDDLKKLNKNKKLGEAFRALTPGRRRGYVLHFTAAKQSKTRTARIEKCIPAILAGKGIHDR